MIKFKGISLLAVGLYFGLSRMLRLKKVSPKVTLPLHFLCMFGLLAFVPLFIGNPGQIGVRESSPHYIIRFVLRALVASL